MKKTKKVGIIIFAILIVVLIICAIIFIIKGISNDLTINMYKKISDSEKFTLTMEEIDSEYECKIKIARRDTDISVDTDTNYLDDEEHTTTIITDDNAYYVTHEDQEYVPLDSSDIEVDMLIPEIKDIDGKTYKKGKEEIKGKTYYYEEYEDISTFLMFINAGEGSNLKTRFYYDDNKQIVYIKNIVQETEGDTKEEILKVNCVYDAEDTLFTIPEEYAESKF